MEKTDFLYNLKSGDYKTLARTLTKVENNLKGADLILKSLKPSKLVPVIGITGPPGSGKSTLVNALIHQLSKENKRIAVLAIDPTSPFNFGSLLGDRIRMNEHFNNPNVFIRSLATRGSLGGLSEKTIEMVDVLKSSGFDYVIIETVGVGQSEVEIAGLADVTIVVLVPESGDEIQNIKSGLMEIANIFVVNKADREGANIFSNNLKKLLHKKTDSIPVIQTIADKAVGVDELANTIKNSNVNNSRGSQLLTEKAWKLIQVKRMLNIDKKQLELDIKRESLAPDFNLYTFVENYKAS